MTDQRILNSGFDNITNHLKNEFAYVALGNGAWSDNEMIPPDTNVLRHEVGRVPVMNVSEEDGVITYFTSFRGTDIKDESGGIVKYTLTEVAVTNTGAASPNQSFLLMKVFPEITVSESDSKVLKVVVNLRAQH